MTFHNVTACNELTPCFIKIKHDHVAHDQIDQHERRLQMYKSQCRKVTGEIYPADRSFEFITIEALLRFTKRANQLQILNFQFKQNFQQKIKNTGKQSL